MSRVAPEESAALRVLRRQFERDLGLASPPVQVSYLAEPPAGTSVDPAAPPSVCTYFAAGRHRVTVAATASHGNCELGAYVLGLPPVGELGERLSTTVAWMEREHYLQEGESGRIPHNSAAPAFVAYGPLGSLPVPPTVVLLFAPPRALMLAVEATTRRWPKSPPPPFLSRPMCSIVPVLLQGAPVAISVGCAGSRVYTEMGEDELVIGVRYDALQPFADSLKEIRAANEAVTALNRTRKDAARATVHARKAPKT